MSMNMTKIVTEDYELLHFTLLGAPSHPQPALLFGFRLQTHNTEPSNNISIAKS